MLAYKSNDICPLKIDPSYYISENKCLPWILDFMDIVNANQESVCNLAICTF